MSPAPGFLKRAPMAAFVPEPQIAPGEMDIFGLPQVSGGHAWKIALQHDRPQNLLIWITRGQGRVTLNGLRRGLGAHNALFLPAGTLFALDPGPQSLVQFLISPPGLTGRLPRKPVHLRVRDGFEQGELTGLFDALQRELRGTGALRPVALQAQMSLVAVWLHRQIGAGHADAPRETAAHRLVRRYAQRLVSHYGQPLTMADHAEALDVTPTHLTRVCREACGLTAAEMLIQRRLHAARSLLAQPGPSIREIARQTGFSSPAYFSRFIQAHTGAAPSALRSRSVKSA